MDKTENEELNGNNVNVKKNPDLSEGTIDSQDGFNFDNIAFSSLCGGDIEITSSSHDYGEPNQELEKCKTGRNNHHVVPIGVLTVLVTIYLGMTSIQKCFVNCSKNEILDKSSPEKGIFLYEDHHLQDSAILERLLLEYEGVCKDLEVFTKDINNINDEDGEREGEEILVFPLETEVNSGSGSGDCTRPYSKKKKKSKYSIKLPTNGKNGFHKNNKSYVNKAKYAHNDKKDLHLNKKNSTAEPIIYLFALVFVYLLLKAASDINQHYKSQTKNDKRLRRCSLQSYAQTHRPDRRSSKELAIKQKQQRLMAAFSRSISIEQQQQYQVSAPQRTPPTPPTQPSLLTRTTTPRNWQLLRQHMQLSVDNSDITASTPSMKPEFSSAMNRRCSVPVALNYQRQTHKNSPIPLGILTDTLINRRTSITMPLDAIDPLAIETKRRVRMINRH